MSPKLEATIDKILSQARGLLIEAAPQMEEAMVQSAAEAQTQDSDAVFKFSINGSINMDKGQLDTSVGWSVRHKLTATCEIPDPNQPALIPEE